MWQVASLAYEYENKNICCNFKN